MYHMENDNSEKTMMHVGEGNYIEKVDTEEKLVQALNQAASYEELEKIISAYNSQFDERYRGGKSVDEYSATINTGRDYVLIRKEFADSDAIVIQRNRITELRKREKLAVGDTVRVMRGDKTFEDGWKITGTTDNGFEVEKGELSKPISYSRLLEMNSDTKH